MTDEETPVEERESLTGAAPPLCARCGGSDHAAPACPTLRAAVPPPIDPDAEGTR